MELSGLSGRISFDSRGLRTDYQLDVWELSYNTPSHKAVLVVAVIVIVIAITTICMVLSSYQCIATARVP